MAVEQIWGNKYKNYRRKRGVFGFKVFINIFFIYFYSFVWARVISTFHIFR